MLVDNHSLKQLHALCNGHAIIQESAWPLIDNKNQKAESNMDVSRCSSRLASVKLRHTHDFTPEHGHGYLQKQTHKNENHKKNTLLQQGINTPTYTTRNINSRFYCQESWPRRGAGGRGGRTRDGGRWSPWEMISRAIPPSVWCHLKGQGGREGKKVTQGVKECERGLEWVMEGRSREKERKIKKV